MFHQLYASRDDVATLPFVGTCKFSPSGVNLTIGARVGAQRRSTLTLTAVVVAALAGASFTDSLPAATAAAKVCGDLVPDAEYQTEADVIGVGHACEHLKGRKWGKASRIPAARPARRPSSSVTVASALGTTPAEVGSWSSAANPGTKTVGISAVLFHTGKVLLFGGKYNSTDKNTAAYLYDPVTGKGHEVPAPAAVYCGSITQLSDGRLLSAGGASPVPKGIVDLWLFDPVSEQWLRQPDTPLGRYYPTSTRLADGRILITAGDQLDGQTRNPTVEVYTPPPAGATMGSLEVVGPAHATGFYPTQWLMPDGKVLQVEGRSDYVLDPASWGWSSLPLLPSGTGAGPAGLMLPGGPSGSSRVMMIGGLVKNNLAQNKTFRYDYANPSAGWSAGTPMPTTRSHMNVVQVPDGSAFGIGGNSSDLYGQGQKQTMSYDPATDTWTNMAIQAPRRAYHSTALLLPDGRIMSAGDTGSGGGRQLIDFYSPPYLFKGPRPQITSAPSAVDYGSTFAIGTTGPTAARAVLMAPGATTHAVEMNARHVEIAVTATADGFTASAPPTGKVAPPGYYMLFVLTPDGIPSTATWLHIGP